MAAGCPQPGYGMNDALIRVRRTGICGTDLHIHAWDEWAAGAVPVGIVIGHEFIGEVVALGSNVSDFHVGALVSGEVDLVCGRCRNCMAGRRHLCAHSAGWGSTTRALRRADRAADDQRLAPRSGC